MRWFKKKEPKDGDTKIITKFLLLPCELKGETRWLETVNIKCVFIQNLPSGGGWGSKPNWYMEEFC